MIRRGRFPRGLRGGARIVMLAAAGTALTVGLLAESADPGNEDARRAEVDRTERAFARTLADRDFDAFVGFIADDAVFVSSGSILRGREAVTDAWRRFFDGPDAPFSWEPEIVEVVAAGDLALSTGPVRGPDGSRIGTFTSVWRRETTGTWRIVFDRGCPGCDDGDPNGD